MPINDPARNQDPGLTHLSVQGDTYTILLTGDETGGRFTIIDMYVPPGGGPPPHRHDFEETFIILDGRLDVTFRDATQAAGTGTTINVPANAAHQFRNSSDEPARLLCICAPAGGRVLHRRRRPRRGPDRTGPPPSLDVTARAARRAKAQKLAASYPSSRPAFGLQSVRTRHQPAAGGPTAQRPCIFGGMTGSERAWPRENSRPSRVRTRSSGAAVAQPWG